MKQVSGGGEEEGVCCSWVRGGRCKWRSVLRHPFARCITENLCKCIVCAATDACKWYGEGGRWCQLTSTASWIHAHTKPLCILNEYRNASLKWMCMYFLWRYGDYYYGWWCLPVPNTFNMTIETDQIENTCIKINKIEGISITLFCLLSCVIKNTKVCPNRHSSSLLVTLRHSSSLLVTPRPSSSLLVPSSTLRQYGDKTSTLPPHLSSSLCL